MSSMPISGGSSPIPGGVPLVETSGGTQTGTTTTTTTELPPVQSYLSLPFARGAFATLGIDVPKTPDDVASILADIMMKLEETVGEVRDNRAEALAARARGATTNLFGMIANVQTLTAEIVAAQAQVQTKTQELNGKSTELNSLTAELTTLYAQYGAAETDEERAEILEQIQTVEAEILVVQSEMTTLTNAINALNTSITDKTNEINSTISILISSIMFFIMMLMGIAPVNERRDAQQDMGVSQLFDQLSERLGGAGTTPLSLDVLLLQDRTQTEELLKKLARVLGTEIDPAVLTQLLTELGFPENEERLPPPEPRDGDTLLRNLFGGGGVPGPNNAPGPFQNPQFTPPGSTANIQPTNTQNTTTQTTEPETTPIQRTTHINQPQNLERPQNLSLPQNVEEPPNDVPVLIQQVNIIGLVMLAALTGLTIDQLRDEGVRGRVISSAVGLVAGLADVVTTLAALEALESPDMTEKDKALDEGFKFRLAI